ncbi:hypothetical protein [Companilactobacillus sp. DQM5]|uniref:hypothetical protein n=1 Tax=Companilactobacillus sp. DQM5 TaxID=3463359 RepID=UPI0040598187
MKNSKIISQAETRANTELLNSRRDKIITLEDVDETFKIAEELIKSGNPEWVEDLHFTYSTIRKLEIRGCDVKRLKELFTEKSEELLKL